MKIFKEFFGFNQKPFKSTPDLTFYYPTKLHVAILDSIFDFINSNNSFAVIIGEAGAGKTFLVNKFLKELPTNVIGSYILYPNLASEKLLIVILESFDIQADKSLTKNELAIKLKEFLKDIKSQEKKAVIVFDNAQNLSNETLEELYSLSNLDENSNLLKVILIGQDELNDKLNKENLRKIKEISLNIKLSNLSKADIKDYIYSHIDKAGGNQIKIKNNVIKQIAKITLGNPRLINIIMKKTIISAFLDSSYIITKNHLLNAISSLNYIKGNIYKKRINAKLVLAILVFILVIATLFFNKGKIFNNKDVATSNIIAQSTNTEKEANIVKFTDIDLQENTSKQENTNKQDDVLLAESIDNEVAQALKPESASIPTQVSELVPIEKKVKEVAVAPEIQEIQETPKIPETPEVEAIAEQVEATQEIKDVYILVKSLNVRVAPSLTADVVAGVVASGINGQTYEYVSENDEWVEIRLSPTSTGWVFKQYVRIVEGP